MKITFKLVKFKPMDLRSKWKICHQSICLIKHLDSNNNIISCGTGFKIEGNKILTNNHVFACSTSIKTSITFYESNGIDILQERVYARQDHNKLLIAGDPVNGWDFAIINADGFETIPGLYLAKKEFPIAIGTKVYFLGFPLQSESLTIHSGNISANYRHQSGIKYIQIDGSVNSGNSGGPLIDYDNDLVIGLITRKKTGLSEKFRELKESFKSNIAKLQNRGAYIDIAGVDPVEALKITQLQLDLLSDEILRSANVGIGYAFELDEIRNYV